MPLTWTPLHRHVDITPSLPISRLLGDRSGEDDSTKAGERSGGRSFLDRHLVKPTAGMAARGGPGRGGDRAAGHSNASNGISAETQKLVQGMMKASHLTPFQQRHLTSKLQRGEALPAAVDPSSSRDVSAPRVTPVSKVERKVVDPRTAKPGLRPAGKIARVERERFHPANSTGLTREGKKEQLVDTMAFGRETALRKQEIRARGPSKLEQHTDEEELTVYADDFERIAGEIDERRAYLETMSRLGHKTDLSDVRMEIAQRTHQLELIDRQRNAELQAMEGALGGASPTT